MKRKEKLFLVYPVTSSHDDCEVYDDVEVGYNERFELVIRRTTDDGYLHRVDVDEFYADRESAYRLSRRMNVRMISLPETIARACRTPGKAGDFPSYAGIVDSFRELTTILDTYGCRYRYRRRRMA